jgi:hypothetical protein
MASVRGWTMNQKQKLIISIVVPILIIFITLALTFPEYNRHNPQHFWRNIFLSLSISSIIILAFLWLFYREKRARGEDGKFIFIIYSRVSALARNIFILLIKVIDWFWRMTVKLVVSRWVLIIITVVVVSRLYSYLKLNNSKEINKSSRYNEMYQKYSIPEYKSYINGIDTLNKANKELKDHNFIMADFHYREAIRLLSTSPSPVAKIKLEEAKSSLDNLQVLKMSDSVKVNKTIAVPFPGKMVQPPAALTGGTDKEPPE